MAKRSGLGRGLDGMFTAYLNTDAESEKKNKDKKETSGKTGTGTGTKKDADSTAKKTTKAGKSEKSGKTVKTGKGVAAESDVSAKQPKTTDPIQKDGLKETEGGVTFLKLSLVEPNREQPRKEFQEEGLQELAASIRQYGVLQPLVVQKRDDYYEIIAGERRWRAARIAGLKEVPVIIKDYTDQEIVEVSLIENIQREDLNPVEEALAYQRLLDEFSLRQEDIAKRVSKNRSTITNSLRLLKLDPRVRELLAAGVLSGGHARTLLSLENGDMQLEAAQRIIDENLSVREVEKLVKALQRGERPKKKNTKTDTAFDLVCESMENDMKAALGTQVHVNRKNAKAGKIEIEYYSMEELERLFDLIRMIGRS